MATRGLAAFSVGVALAMAPQAASAQDSGAAHTAHSGFFGIGAALCTLVYSPLKFTYAVTGTVLSGMAWLWTVGDTDVAGTILKSSIGGNYVVHPANLTGEEPLSFVGRTY